MCWVVSGFKHRRVHHSKTSVNRKGHPIIRLRHCVVTARSNGIENFWSQSKRILRKYNGIPRKNFHLIPERMRIPVQRRQSPATTLYFNPIGLYLTLIYDNPYFAYAHDLRKRKMFPSSVDRFLAHIQIFRLTLHQQSLGIEFLQRIDRAGNLVAGAGDGFLPPPVRPAERLNDDAVDQAKLQ